MSLPDRMPAMQRRAFKLLSLTVICFVEMCLTGCVNLGAERLNEDQLSYSQSLSSSEKQETLLNAVRLRYGDTPSFLQITQVISGYQLQRNLTGGFSWFPSANPSNSIIGSGGVQFQQSPTFTFQPVTGEQFAQSFIRPLSPSELLPLSLSGMPIDVLFRLGVQSVNSLQNSMALTGTGGEGSPDFFLLLRDLRQLQVAGLLDVRLEVPPAGAAAKPDAAKNTKVEGKVFLALTTTSDAALASEMLEAKRLIGMPENAQEIEVVYGRYAPGKIAILTRSMLGVLTELGAQVEVPSADVTQGQTLASVGNVGVEKRATVVIHSGASAPADAFVLVQYHGSTFWIDDSDFDSKFAFTIANVLLNLARTTNAPGTVVTIPAG